MVFFKIIMSFTKANKRQFRYRKVTKQFCLIASFCLAIAINVPRTHANEIATADGAELSSESSLISAPAAPNPDSVGPFATTAAEYRFPATVDPDIIGDRPTEVWAVVYRPTNLLNKLNPVIVFLHGNHPTCGTGANPRIDDRIDYTFTGACPANYVVVPNHRGYDYLARRLASWGYVVVSVNANRGINAAPGISGDAGLNLTRGQLILKHLQLLSTWNTFGGTPASLGVDLRGKLDFNNVGLMGHSRGGEGMRAAYNLYRDPNSPWVDRIPNRLKFKGIFEFAPVDGQTSRTLNIDGVPWNVLLPQCDGDVSNLQGVKPFDRVLYIFDENPITQKSTYTVWGANHNYYNTEWQTSDSDVCLNHTPIFNPGASVGSAPQRQTGLVSLVAFMRGNIPGSVGFNPSFNQNFNPQFALPNAIAAITRVDRGYTSSPNRRVTAILEDFDQPTGTSSAGLPNIASNVTVIHDGVPEHDPILRAGTISWLRSGNDVFFQTNVANSGQGVDLSDYKTLDLRLENQEFSTTPTNFSVALVLPNNTLSRSVAVRRYVDLRGPVGGPGGIHRMLQTARISLSDFGVKLNRIRGLRLIFNRTGRGAIYVANIRLSTVSELGKGGYFLPEQAANLASAQPSSVTQQQPAAISEGNKVIGIRNVVSSSLLNNGSGVEIEVYSDRPFPVRNEMPVLRIGDREFMLSRYPDDGDTNRLIFTIAQDDFAKISSGEPMWIQYGRDETTQRWNFGQMDKNMLDRNE